MQKNLDKKKDEFYTKLLVALDRSMRDIFGEETVNAVYYYLRDKHMVKLEDILEKPESFTRAIKAIFGDAGADVIEGLLVKSLCDEFGMTGQIKEAAGLVDCLDELKVSLSKTVGKCVS
jgi:hypothetical protein